jgi:DNA-binding CsgD family transcriptional regulator
MTQPNPREIDILALFASGLAAKTVAHKLGIQPSTIWVSMRIIRKKLGASNTTHAVAIAIQTGIIKVNLPVPAAQ